MDWKRGEVASEANHPPSGHDAGDRARFLMDEARNELRTKWPSDIWGCGCGWGWGWALLGHLGWGWGWVLLGPMGRCSP